MKVRWFTWLALGCLCLEARGEPPFSGTIFVDPDILTEADPTTYLDMVPAGTGRRQMYDRRSGWVTHEAFLFQARYDDGLTIEIQVNPEFETEEAAQAQAERFAPVIGRLPTGLRQDVDTVWIHQGVNPFGGGNRNLLIHTGQAERYLADGILEETLVHEASHTSLDADHATAPDWLAAQEADGEFISTYARDNERREDVAETFLLYLAYRHLRERISNELANTIADTIPHRIAYFDEANIDLYPVVSPAEIRLEALAYDRNAGELSFSWQSEPFARYVIEASLDLTRWEEVAERVASGSTTDATLIPSEDRVYYRVRRPAMP